MRGDSHKAVTAAALTLLPKAAQAFFATEFGEWEPGTNFSYLDVILDATIIEDDLPEPRTYPIHIAPDSLKEAIEFLVSGPFTGAALLIPQVREMFDGLRADSEHFWQHDYGDIGLSHPFGISAEWRCAPARAQDHWDAMGPERWHSASPEERFDMLHLLGRVIHLLEDMGVPAHTHGDAHPHIGVEGAEWIFDDDYEDYIEERIERQAVVREQPRTVYALPEEWQPDGDRDLLYYDPGWVLRDHFFHMASITNLYDCDDVDGLGSGKPYRWDSIFDSWDAHRDITFDLTDYACEAIARDLIPLNISFVAGLYIRFLSAIGESYPGLYIARVTVDRLEVHDDTDPMGPGEIFLDVKLGPEEKRVDRLGQYNMDDGDTRNIGKTYSFVIEEGDSIHFVLRAFDDDSWWGEPGAYEGLGTVTEDVPYATWAGWINHSVSHNRLSNNGYCRIAYTIEVLPAITEDTGRRPPLRWSRETLPPLLLNVDSGCLHRQNCHCIDRMREENKATTYLLPYEISREMLSKLSESIVDPRLAARLRSGDVRRCRRCFVA